MMHENEVATDADQVRRLVAAQFPEWAGLEVTAMPIGGTDHALYRIGDELVARLPRIEWALDQADSDRRWLPRLAPHLPVPIPVPIATGQPAEGFPWEWSVVPWLPGDNPTPANADLDGLAHDLAEFVVAMHAIDPTGGPLKTGTTRGVPLQDRDDLTRQAIDELGDRIDSKRITEAWGHALTAAPWTKDPVWIHGDLLAGNLLVTDRRLSAVIDFGGLGLGDPAPDLVPAWNLLDGDAREIFRKASGYDDDTWRRGWGWSLSTSLVALPYYWDTAPDIAAKSRQTIATLLSEKS
jgi:aminoglycoside phosphotransferase (APT) family kinase protein